MPELRRLKNRLIAKAATAFPYFKKLLTESYQPAEQHGVPWTAPVKRLGESSVSIVTTAGVHMRDQTPFDMKDPNGDPSLRIMEGAFSVDDLKITHDYYDHKEADRDINIVFPIERLREFEKAGLIKSVAPVHFGFMGHILGAHIRTLIEVTAPEAAARLKSAGVDIVLVTPG